MDDQALEDEVVTRSEIVITLVALLVLVVLQFFR